jgi:predicted enzyme related to lactoylglutathione lyase
MAVVNALASLAVRNLTASIGWYETLFARAPDSRPMPEVAEWKFERGGWLQLYQLSERAGAGSVTLAVSDLEEQLATLRRLGIEPGRPMTTPQARVVMVKDPDGNSIAFAETRDPRIAR